MKIILNLPISTHRNLIVPLSGRPHLRTIFIKRFINFIKKVDKSNKTILKTLLQESKDDTRSTTGHNLRWLFLQSGVELHDLDDNTAETIGYHEINHDEEWRIEMLRMMINAKDDSILDDEEEELFELLCTA